MAVYPLQRIHLEHIFTTWEMAQQEVVWHRPIPTTLLERTQLHLLQQTMWVVQTLLYSVHLPYYNYQKHKLPPVIQVDALRFWQRTPIRPQRKEMEYH